MKLKDPALLRQFIKDRGTSQSKLAEEVGVSRQFIWQLLNDPTMNTCSHAKGLAIEEALLVERGLLFDRSTSSNDGSAVNRQSTAGVA